MKTHRAETICIDRADSRWVPCDEVVDRIVVRLDGLRQATARTLRFVAADGTETTRFGEPLRDFDLEPLFSADDPDGFVVDGRFEALLDALDREDGFVEPNRRTSPAEVTEWLDWMDASPSGELACFVRALRAHPDRALVGWEPTLGSVHRTTGQRWCDPFETLAAEALAFGGVSVGWLQPTAAPNHLPLRRFLASLLYDPSTGVVVELGDAPFARRTTLGGLAFGTGLLTAFEARRVSWSCLEALAPLIADRFCMNWYAPSLATRETTDAYLPPSSLTGLPDPSGEPAARWLHALLRGDETARSELAAPTFPLPAAPTAARFASLVHTFFTAHAEALDAALGEAKGSSVPALAEAAQRLDASRHTGTLGACDDVARQRARWRRGAPVELPDGLSDEALLALAWERVADEDFAARFEARLVGEDADLRALVETVRALESFDPREADIAWRIASAEEARRERMLPLVANAALAGPDGGAYRVLRYHLGHLRRAPRWRPIAVRVGADRRFGDGRFDWLVGCAEGSDVVAVVATLEQMMGDRRTAESAFGFDFAARMDALVEMRSPHAPALLAAALEIERLYPVEAAKLAAFSMRLGSGSHTDRYVQGVRLIGNSATWWTNVRDLVAAALVLNDPQRATLLASIETAEGQPEEWIRRVQRRVLGATDPTLGDELLGVFDEEAGLDARLRAGFVRACGGFDWVPDAFLTHALDDVDPRVRLAGLAARTERAS